MIGDVCLEKFLIIAMFDFVFLNIVMSFDWLVQMNSD